MNSVESNDVRKKRSAGVIIFALSIIVISILRLLGTGSISAGFSQILPKAALVLIIIYSVISNIGYIIGAVNIFRLKNWARKLVLSLTAIQLLYMLVIAIPLSNRSIEAMKTSPGAQERIWAGYETIPEKLRLDSDITEEEYSELVFKKIYQTALVVKTIAIFYLFLVLFFFTRRRVKEQFLCCRAAPSETGK